MASGFIVLQDGRCFARRWWCYDLALREIITELTRDPQEQELANWLASLLPGPDDVELNYGWIRESDGENVLRHIDVRELTEANQQRFNGAARCALKRLQEADTSDINLSVECLSPLVEMIERAERGEPPLSLSDWRDVRPPSGERSGPGWDNTA